MQEKAGNIKLIIILQYRYNSGMYCEVENCTKLKTTTSNYFICLYIGAAKMGTCMVLSTWGQYSIEEVAQASPTSLKWFQLYIFTDRELSRNLVQRAEKAGYKALVVTVDHAVFGKCLARNNFKIPFSMFWNNFKSTSVESMLNKSEPFIDTKVVFPLFESGLTWEDIDWLRGITKLPIILKGILTAEDAEEALKHDIQGIIVSNHGGRQLDGALATVSWTVVYISCDVSVNFPPPH